MGGAANARSRKGAQQGTECVGSGPGLGCRFLGARESQAEGVPDSELGFS